MLSTFLRLQEPVVCEGVIVETPEAFRRELAQALKSDRTTLIDARVDPQAYQDSFGPTIGDLSRFSPG